MSQDLMTNREQAKMLGYEGLHTFLHETATIAIYTGDGPFVLEVTVFDFMYQTNKDLAQETDTDNTGFSEVATAALAGAGKKAAFMSGRAQVKFEIGGHHDLALQCHIFDSYFTQGSYASGLNAVKAARKLMNDNIGLLTGYVSAADIAVLDGLITALETAMGSSETVHAAEPIDTDKFKKSFSPVDKSIKRLVSLSRFDDDFHTQIVKRSAVPAVNIHHTVVSVALKNKRNNAPIEGATGVLSVTDKVGLSDYLGIMLFEQVRNGQGISLKIMAAGFADLLLHIAIEQGRDNHFDLGMEEVANPA